LCALRQYTCIHSLHSVSHFKSHHTSALSHKLLDLYYTRSCTCSCGFTCLSSPRDITGTFIWYMYVPHTRQGTTRGAKSPEPGPRPSALKSTSFQRFTCQQRNALSFFALPWVILVSHCNTPSDSPYHSFLTLLALTRADILSTPHHHNNILT